MRRSFTAFILIAILTSISSAQLSGPLSGTYGPGSFAIIGDISVLEGDSLVILPGTSFLFGSYTSLNFEVYGYLYAVGTEADSIYLMPEIPAYSWHGVDFNDSCDDSSRLGYCQISGSNASGVDCFSSGPTIANCSIYDNTGNFGGGLYSSNGGSPKIYDCVVSGNASNVCGAGMWASSSDIVIDNCIFTGNNAGNSAGGIYCYQSSALITNCTVTENTSTAGAGGIFCRGTNQVISNCTISGNSTETIGGGICCNNATTVIDHCTITDNYAGIAGGGIEAYISTPTIENCTISGNMTPGAGGGIESYDSSPIIINTIVEGNFGQGGIYFFNGLGADVTYCDFNDNEGGDFIGYYLPELGQITAVNANGDSCDMFCNIFEDPVFYATSGDSAYFLNPDSPCIDAGDPDPQYTDPDGTVADIGAHYYHQESTSPITITLTPYNPPITIPAAGGSLDYNIGLSNNEPAAQNFDLWIMVILPNGTQYGPVLGPVDLTLDGNTSVARDRNQVVPGNAPEGTYTYEGRVGIYPDIVWDTDSFPFEKLGTDFSGNATGWFNSGEEFHSIEETYTEANPDDLPLLSAYPNPFNLSTVFGFTLRQDAYIELSLFDIAGNLVCTVEEGNFLQGYHEISFDATDLSSGIYVSRLRAENTCISSRVILIK
ncbi:hypothetical protein CEE37_13030 [candidate division LCP-89 bacterium B3_LCP]|uniref:Secretion system C-terminal sorting domain-containing protein n=1 Tax=candidate division LCP-89 bacterium B3_LCP TaxID=2012998 RepID=A0A532UU04_UNCL8|nr:MAG: hypothetical protein CEE37_13030 [candidate division LCP-89 bacterium B3_LCP]